jgi:competence protein ComEA
MKNWHYTLLWLFVGMIATAALFLVTSPPRGKSVELLPAPSPAPIMVHVDGAVQHPGVYPLPRESRVQDVIQAAGGFAQKANTDAINLAARLEDGDKLVVPQVGTPAAPPSVVAPTASRANPLPESKSTPGALVNINTATLEELQTLPGIGATRAQDIINYRQAHGAFKTIEDLGNVTGIGQVTIERLKDLITLN